MNIILFVPMVIAQIAFIWLCMADKTIPTNVTDVLIFGLIVANLVAVWINIGERDDKKQY